jgi:6-phosphogluconolactonase
MLKQCFLLCTISLSLSLMITSPTIARQTGDETTSRLLVYVGTYSSPDQDGIHICELNLESGQLSRLSGVSGIRNPSFLALHPNGRYLYAVSESQRFDGKPTGSVTAFVIQDSGRQLTKINEQSSVGQGPCHVAVDPTGKFVAVANYGGGSVTVLPVQDDGGLSPSSDHVQHEGSSVNPQRQKGPHAHCVNFDAAGRYLISCDLGLDKALIYRFDTRHGTLEPNPVQAAVTVTPGAGPRHFAFHPNGKLAYAINELNSTVTAFRYDSEQGTLQTIESHSTLPSQFDGQSTTAEIEISADGRFLYGSNRGHDSLAIFSIDRSTGELNYITNQKTLGKTPRNFAMSPHGNYLLAANQDSDSVVVFRRDRQNGTLTAAGSQVTIAKPVCLIYREPDN